MDAYDFLMLLGLACIGVGLWLVAPALSLTVIGVLLLVLAVAGAARRAAKNSDLKDQAKR